MLGTETLAEGTAAAVVVLVLFLAQRNADLGCVALPWPAIWRKVKNRPSLLELCTNTVRSQNGTEGPRKSPRSSLGLKPGRGAWMNSLISHAARAVLCRWWVEQTAALCDVSWPRAELWVHIYDLLTLKGRSERGLAAAEWAVWQPDKKSKSFSQWMENFREPLRLVV